MYLALPYLHQLRTFDRERMLKPEDRWQCRVMYSLGETVVSPAAKTPTCCLFAHATPLFEEERHVRRLALLVDREHPILPHGPGAGPAFSADDDPRYTFQRQLTDVFEKRLN